MPETPATTALKRAKIPFDLLEYVHDPRAEAYGLEAVQKLGLDPADVFKTLVVWDEGKRWALALVPTARRLSLSEAARALGWKRADMAKPDDAQRLTGYVLGGISPFGTKRPLPVVADESLATRAFAHVSGGRRGVEIKVRPDLLVSTLGAILARIAVD